MKEAAEELRRSDILRPDMPETLYSLGKAPHVQRSECCRARLRTRYMSWKRKLLLPRRPISLWLEFTGN